MKTGTLILLIVILSLSENEPLYGQSRKSVNLNENWIVREARSGFNLDNSIPGDFQNPGEDWFKANMPKQIQDIQY